MTNLPYISPEIIAQYQKGLGSSTAPATAKRRISSLKKFLEWAHREGHVRENPFTPVLPIRQPQGKKISKGIKASLVLAGTFGMAALTFLLIRKLGTAIPFRLAPAQEAPVSKIQVGTPVPTVPGQQSTINNQPSTSVSPWTLYSKLNFKDESGEPVTQVQSITFSIYKDQQSTSPLWTSLAQEVTPDSEGNVRVVLKDVPMNLFFGNETLYLEANLPQGIGGTRVPVPTAADLGNTQTALLDENGNLLLAGESPKITAKEGNLFVEGQAVTIKTADGSDGNIEINPDGNGYAHFLFEGNGQNFLNAQAPNLTRGSLYYGIVANNSTGYDLIRLQNGSKATTRFAVDAGGNITSTGNLAIGGGILTSNLQRLTSGGALTNITGYSQSSGNFAITQTAGDTATITKKDSALSDLLTLTLDERGKKSTGYSTLTLKRYDGSAEAYALFVDEGNARFDGQLQLGQFASNPSSGIGKGSLIFNTADNTVYVWNGSSWSTISGGGSALVVQESDTTVAATAGTLDFLGGDFDVTESPANEANITLAATLTTPTAVAGDFSINGGDLTTTQTTATLFNTTATTLSIGGAATTLSLGASTGTTTVNNDLAVTGGDVNGPSGENIDLGEATADTITFYIAGSAELSLNTSALFPSTDSGQDLGTSSSQFADLYLDGGNINLDNATDIDIDDNTAASFTVSEGTNNYLLITTTDTGTVATFDLPVAGSSTTTGNLFTANTTKTINLGTGTAADTINIGTGTTTADIITIGNSVSGTTVAITSGTGSNSWSITSAGAATFGGHVTLSSDASEGLSGGGLTDCDTAATSKLLWDTTTNKFSCGTDQDSGASTTTLQIAYNNDADGSDAIIALTTADDSLIVRNPAASGTDSTFTVFIDQLNTTGATSALDISTASNGSDAVNLTANSVDGETILDISGTGLTTGKGISFTAGSSLTTGNVISVSSASYSPAAGATGTLVNLSLTDIAANTTSNSIVNALNVSSTLNTSGVTGTKEFNALNVASPTFTACTDGSCTWSGLKVGGATAGATITEYGVNIGSITAGAGSEIAINIGAGWDTGIDAGTNSIINIGDTGTDILSTGATFGVHVTLSGDANEGLSGGGLTDCDTAATSKLLWDTTTNKFSCGTDQDSGASTTTLQIAYNNDADGSDAIIALTTADDSLIFRNPAASGTDSAFTVFIDQLNTTGAVTALDIAQASNAADAVNITANSIDTENALDISATALTSGVGIKFTGSAASGITGSALSLTSDVGSTGELINLAPDFSGAGVTGYGTYLSGTQSANAANVAVGYYGTLASSSTTADTLAVFDAATTTSGIIIAGTRSVYGVRSQPASTGASTGGTTDVYGVYSKAGGTVGIGGTINAYGLYVANGTMDTTGTSTNTGLYVESPTGADTNYAAIFAGGNVGIGDTTPDYLLELSDTTNTPAFALSDDDVAHGVTTLAETDVFGHLSSISTTVGGLQVTGLADATGIALGLKGVQSSDPTDTTPAISLIGAKASGTGVVDLGAAETVLQVANNDDTAALTVLGSGFVGIGQAVPTTALHVGTSAETHALSTGDALISSDLELDGVLYLDGGIIADVAGTSTITLSATPTTTNQNLTNGSWKVNNTANVGLAALMVDQQKAGDLFTASAAGTTRFLVENDGDVFITTSHDSTTASLTVSDTSGTGTGKINVGTVDPIYTVGDGKYATYMAGMVGVKEEVTGNIATNEYIPGIGYRKVVDFKTENAGSDLWLFSKATNLKDNIDKLVVLLSPEGNNRAWYRLDDANYTLSIYTTKPTNVSFRLTAPRFDYALWTNYSHEPDVSGFILADEALNGNGEIENPEEDSLANYQIEKVETDSGIIYQLEDLAGTVINEFAKVSDFLAANITAGILRADKVVTENLVVNNKLISPIVETTVITPPQGEDLTVKLSPSEDHNSSFVIQNSNSEEVASIDTEGNATFSGTLEADKVKTNDLTAGKIYADEIVARNGYFGATQTESAGGITREEIEKILSEVEESQELLSQAASWSVNTATESGVIKEVDAEKLFVTDLATVNSLSVAETITTGNDLVISSIRGESNVPVNTINTLTSPLSLQSLALAPVEIMAGKVRIETDGDVYIDANLYVAGNIEANQATFKGLTLQGDAEVNKLTTDQLIIAGSQEATPSAVVNGEITTNATVGQATIAAGVTEITIRNPKITDYTLVYITPTSSTENKTLYVKSKGAGFFTVGFSDPISTDTNFNWWVVEVAQ